LDHHDSAWLGLLLLDTPWLGWAWLGCTGLGFPRLGLNWIWLADPSQNIQYRLALHATHLGWCSDRSPPYAANKLRPSYELTSFPKQVWLFQVSKIIKHCQLSQHNSAQCILTPLSFRHSQNQYSKNISPYPISPAQAYAPTHSRTRSWSGLVGFGAGFRLGKSLSLTSIYIVGLLLISTQFFIISVLHHQPDGQLQITAQEQKY
jgi:hypothetical protein